MDEGFVKSFLSVSASADVRQSIIYGFISILCVLYLNITKNLTDNKIELVNIV